MNESLLLLDTLSVKKYIFATRYLKEMRGASSLLDEINRITTVKIVKDVTEGKFELIYANGGAALFVVPTESVRAIEDCITKQYNLIGANVNIAYISYQKENFNFRKDFSSLVYRAEQNRYQTEISSKLSHSFFRDCDSNKTQYAIVADVIEEKSERPLLSFSSYKKVEQNNHLKQTLKQGKLKKDSLWYKLNEKLSLKKYPDLNELEFPDTFEDISAFDPDKYIALLYADGNDMGQTIRQEINCLNDMRLFSSEIDNAIYEVTSMAIAGHLAPGTINQKRKLPFDILLIGGDDLVMVVPAVFALEVAKTIGREFNSLTGKSLCIGLAFSHAKYSIHSLLNITEGLLKSAKKERALRLDINPEDKAIKGMINFMLIQQSGSLQWEDYRRDNFVHKETVDDKKILFERTCRPYTFEDLDKLITLGKNFAGLNFPAAKLHALRKAAFKNLYQSMFESLFILTRSNEDQREVLYDLFNLPGLLGDGDGIHDDSLLYYFIGKSDRGLKYKTAILDLLDIYKFLEIRESV